MKKEDRIIIEQEA